MRYAAFIIGFASVVAFFLYLYHSRAIDPLQGTDIKPEYAPAVLGGTELSYIRHYHNLDGVMDRAATADIVVYGNSRSMFGMSNHLEYMINHEHKLDTIYLSHGFRETAGFLHHLDEKHPIKNKLVLLNVDVVFFTRDRVSPPAKQAIELSHSEAHRSLIGSKIRWKFAHLVGARHPIHIKGIYRKGDQEAWVNIDPPTEKFPVEYSPRPSPDQLPEDQIQFAIELVNRLKSNGNQVVFVLVPHNGFRSAHIHQLAEICQVPVIAEELPDMYTYDRAHLHPESAHTYSSWLNKKLQPHIIEYKEKHNLN